MLKHYANPVCSLPRLACRSCLLHSGGLRLRGALAPRPMFLGSGKGLIEDQTLAI
jgi:hypothetical protein